MAFPGKWALPVEHIVPGEARAQSLCKGSSCRPELPRGERSQPRAGQASPHPSSRPCEAGPFPRLEPLSHTESSGGFFCCHGPPAGCFRGSVTSRPTEATPLVTGSGHCTDNLLFFFHVPWVLSWRDQPAPPLLAGGEPGAEVSGQTAGLALPLGTWPWRLWTAT